MIAAPALKRGRVKPALAGLADRHGAPGNIGTLLAPKPFVRGVACPRTLSAAIAALLVVTLIATPVGVAATDKDSFRARDQSMVFAPGVISGPGADIAPAFLPNGQSLYFSRRIGGRFSIMTSRRGAKGWTFPTVAAFSGQWMDLEAAISPRGDYLVFASDRPSAPGLPALRTHYDGADQMGGHLWRVPLRRAGPGLAMQLPAEVNGNNSVWTPSIAANDGLYFMQTDELTGRFRLRRAIIRHGAYRQSRPLSFSTGAANDVDPAVDPRERFVVFSSDRFTPSISPDRAGPEHLFIAFRPGSRRPLVCSIAIPGWTDAQESEVEPRFSPDGHVLYFASRHPDHPLGGDKAGSWDDGTANIWMIPFNSRLWRRAPGAEPACRAHGAA